MFKPVGSSEEEGEGERGESEGEREGEQEEGEREGEEGEGESGDKDDDSSCLSDGRDDTIPEVVQPQTPPGEQISIWSPLDLLQSHKLCNFIHVA